MKRLMRYTSAIVIVCLLWAFIGFSFASRYLKADLFASIIGSVISVILVIQIERQIILSSKGNTTSLYMRGAIAIAMAILGSIIIDQIILKEDIEQEKILTIDIKVNKILPGREEELRSLIKDIDSTILNKEHERKELVADISKNPTITVYNRQVTVGKIADTTNTETITRTSSQIPNPKIVLMESIDKLIENLRVKKMQKDNVLLTLRPVVEEELKRNVGFLNELELMFSIFKRSWIAVAVWLLWFILLFGLEMFILVSKWRETDTDYDKMIEQQMILHFKRIELLSKE